MSVKMDSNNNPPIAAEEHTEREDALDIAAEMEALYITLREYLQMEHKFQPRLILPQRPQNGEITTGARDGAAHVLRYLKVWYDLPTEVLFHAINLLDRFLTKMKVRPCHMSCISVSCINIAILAHQPPLPEINTEELVSISQSRCTVGDVRRMSAIIKDKLGMGEGVDGPLTALQWLRLFCRLMRWAARGMDLPDPNNIVKESRMAGQLEILLGEWSCANVRLCELALAVALDAEPRLAAFAASLAVLVRAEEAALLQARGAALRALQRYEARSRTPQRPRLVWRLSSRTLRHLRPTDRLRCKLPTIAEQNPRRRRNGDSSDSSDSDDDWPTSPTLPIYID